MKSFLYLLFILILNIERASLAYNRNFGVKFVALKPRGLKITLPDNGYTSVNFFGTLQQVAFRKEWQMYSPRAKQNVWVLQDRNMQLNLGDSIQYTITVVDRSGLRFPIQGQWIVNEFIEDEDTPDCVISKTEVQCGKKICSGSLIFTEEFSQFDILNLTRWQFENYYPQEPDYPFNVYLSEAVTDIEDGSLKIMPMPTDNLILKIFIDKSSGYNNMYRCTGEIATSECYRTLSSYIIEPPVISGKVTTRKTFNFKYGKVEIRAKLPEGDWIIPEIVLEPHDHEYGKLRYGSGVIRIAYTRGNREESDDLYGGPVVHDKEPLRSRFLKYVEGNTSWSNDFHTYAVIWRPDSIEMLVDGESYGIFNASNPQPNDLTSLDMPFIKLQRDAWERGSIIAPLDKMFHISLGVRVGGIHDFPDTEEKPWKNKTPKAMHEFATNKKSWYRSWSSPNLLIDYVRVYAL